MNLLVIKSYLPIPAQTESEFWTVDRISHIRALALTGSPQSIEQRKGRRVLDNVFLSYREGTVLSEDPGTDVSAQVAGIYMRSPLYLGDMSYGALSGNPNVVIASVADEEQILAGTGEGGLHPEVAKYKRIFVQWASARFGVDISVLTAGSGVVIKIGQGAKPGIGGHLPGSKVTEPISLARRIPVGIDAISPAPHHDIYSIEDLGQRIENLKEITGKPVFVKVAATNYTPYVVSGIARMGADGVIIDGHGAGTGATPIVVRDNVGIPIELAVASSDRILRREGRREGFTIIAAGRVADAVDAAKLIALGADVVSVGTAALIAMGCVMVHKCHIGSCPTALTNKIDGTRYVEVDFAKRMLKNFVRGFSLEFSNVIKALGLRSARDLVGRRDLLTGYGLSQETLDVLGIKGEASEVPVKQGQPFTKRRKVWLHELAVRGEPVIISMGSTAPPDVEPPFRVLDFLRVDGAQVTRPSIDPYREDIDTSFNLFHGRLLLSAPILVDVSQSPQDQLRAWSWASMALGTGLLCASTPQGYGEISVSADREGAVRWSKEPEKGIVLRLPSTGEVVEEALEAKTVDGFILDEDLGDQDLELSVSDLDTALKDHGVRERFFILAKSSKIRDAGDVFKLIALGADSVILPHSLLDVAIGEGSKGNLGERSFNLLAGIKKEISLLAGAAGMYSLQSSLTGNREILRAVNLDSKLLSRIRVKAAGAW